MGYFGRISSPFNKGDLQVTWLSLYHYQTIQAKADTHSLPIFLMHFFSLSCPNCPRPPFCYPTPFVPLHSPLANLSPQLQHLRLLNWPAHASP